MVIDSRRGVPETWTEMNSEELHRSKRVRLAEGAGSCDANTAQLRELLLGAVAVLLRRVVGETELAVSSRQTSVVYGIRLADQAASAQACLEQLRELDGQPVPRFWVWFDVDADAALEHADLGLLVQTQGRVPELGWIYKASRFSPRRVEVMAEQLEHLLAQMRATPDLCADDYSLVPLKHEKRLPDLRLRLSRPRCTSIPGMVTAWAERAPGALALVRGEQTWSYAVLRERAVAIAEVLRARSGQNRDAVALSGRPSPGLIAAFLGILISGRVLVALDPRLPKARRAVMIREAGVVDLVEVGPSELDEVEELRTLAVDANDGQVDPSLPVAAIPEDLEEDAPAYVIYTSGTTGTPKGILGTRQGIAHYVQWHRERFDLGPADRFAHFTGISFDAVFRDVFVALTCGATLVIPEERDLAAPLEFLRSAGISVLNTVPSRTEHWLRHARLGARLTKLRYSFFGGEALTGEFVRRWRLIAPDSEVHNLYGPTETTIVKCHYPVPEQVEGGVVPIGSPVANSQALILGPGCRQCGIGEIGEIALRTPFRTLGYLNAPAENQARFIVNPSRSDPEDLIYRTGDRGRYRVDGSIEILGRMDHQVKVRGMRIELGDIEAALCRHPDVNRAVVVATEGSTLDRMLVAFVVLSQADLRSSTLRSFLAQQLPAWMLPSAYVVIDDMPLDNNGKTDRNALLTMYAQSSRAATHQAALPSPSEALVIRHVQALLGVDGINADADFFKLGGDSLLAAHLVSRLRRDSGVSLSLRVLFETPTVSEIARSLDAQADSAQSHDKALLGHLSGPSNALETERIEL